jgi:hypothetical protein
VKDSEMNAALTPAQVEFFNGVEQCVKIDTLGALNAKIAELTKQADAIKDELKDAASLSGQKSFEGASYKATYSESNRSTVDWKAIAAELSIPADLIAKHTKTSAVYTIKTVAL